METNQKGKLNFGSYITLLSAIFLIHLFFIQLRSSMSWGWFVFIAFAISERVYETFYTSRKSDRHQLGNDRALFLVVLAYMGAFYGSFYEFYLWPKMSRQATTELGLFLYVTSLIFRWMAIRALGTQWGIHTENQKEENDNGRFVRSGLYRYLRHPYYLFVCLEIISIPLIMHAHVCLIWAILVVCPLEIYRGYLEEKNLVQRFGWPYIKYQNERGGYLPVEKAKNYDRRKVVSPTAFLNRRRKTS